MAKGKSEDQRRRARERKKRKQAERQKERQKQEQANTLEARLTRAAAWPLRECVILENWQETLTAAVILARDRPGGGVWATFVVADLGCLGVKAASTHVFPWTREFDQFRADLIADDTMVPCEPAFALAVLETARRHAADLGFHPDPHYPKAVRLFGPVQPDAGGTQIVCGRDGKPYFAPDAEDDIDAILRRLRHRVGEDGFQCHMEAPTGGI